MENVSVLNIWPALVLYAPLGVIGVWRWSIWLFQWVVSFRYRPFPLVESAKDMRLSIVTPVYNEDPILFENALHSWKRNGPCEIIAVIDASDVACIEVFKKFQETFKKGFLMVTEESGKRPALAKGARETVGDIVALVDSDTVWDDDICDFVLSPFSDPKIGGVTCRQQVINPKTSAEKLFSMRLALRYLHEYPYLMSVGNALTCLSGRTAVYRREALISVLSGMTDETFLGKKCISGEDKRLTSLVMRDGWKVFYQRDVSVRTVGMPDVGKFFKQNLRWARNSWRSDLRLVFSLWTWRREPLFAFHLVDRMIQPFVLLLGPIYFALAISLRHWLAAGIILSWWLVSRTIKLSPYLRENLWGIFSVPLFTFSQYYLAVLKIYALFTLDYQSWITRWHADRLRRKFVEFMELFPSKMATASIVFGFGFVIFQMGYAEARLIEAKKNKNTIPYVYSFESFKLDQLEDTFWMQRDAHANASYATKLGDTPSSIMRLFNIPGEFYESIFSSRSRYFAFPSDTTITFPADFLTYPIDDAHIAEAISRPIVVYEPLKNIIHVKGRGSVASLDMIARALPWQARRNRVLEEIAPKEWILRANLRIEQGATLVVDGSRVEWLKVASSPKGFGYVMSYHSKMLFRDTKVTSWDESTASPDGVLDDGRAMVVAYGSGRMDILNSEMAYLGYPLEVARRLGSFGGTYGVSWKIHNGSFGKNVLSGSAIGNRIHHNYFGIYSYGATALIMRDNEVYENIEYGIDPHDDSNNLLIERNFVHNNGNHGIIGSKRVVYSIIRDNRSVDNKLHGLMLDRQSNWNLVENNIASGNVNGIALYDSHNNLIRRNNFSQNQFGIRANQMSSRNNFFENRLHENKKGIFLYAKSEKNVIMDNDIVANDQGISLRESSGNIIVNSLHNGRNILSLKLDEFSKISNFIEPIQ